jgi:hypothetical protein
MACFLNAGIGTSLFFKIETQFPPRLARRVRFSI